MKNTWIVLVLFLVVIGGLYIGVFSPTEAAGIGAFGAFVFAMAKRRLGWKGSKIAWMIPAKLPPWYLPHLLGAMILNYFIAVTRLPVELSSMISGLQINRYLILGIVLVIYLILGCVMDTMAMMYSRCLSCILCLCGSGGLGFDPIWFGVMVVWMCEMGMITPPVGLNVFVIKGVAKDVPMGTIFRGVVPFILADVVGVILLVVIPQQALLLPTLMK